ncbi:MAG: hypothetical protein KKF74_02350 [Nanoarchaeota archaeon]|nr:hypothetical protein [Nanoarchaeota archaeon]
MGYKNKQIADVLYNKILEECTPIKEIADKLSGLVQKINKGEKVILQQNEAGDYLARVIKLNNTYQSGLPCDISDGLVISEHYF